MVHRGIKILGVSLNWNRIPDSSWRIQEEELSSGLDEQVKPVLLQKNSGYLTAR